ncbi:MAG: endonuclease NucS [Candidatus Bathyarchaeota archaeon]|nr:endonuclease NucS [Candidatus Bathyarchaeota archaeon]
MNREPVSVYKDPTLQEATRLVKEAISQRKTLIMIANCWIDYRGRASSKLEPGERILMIKEDGSLLVHRSMGYEPVNWQPPGCIFRTNISGNVLNIRAVRRKPRESLKINIDKIHLLSVLSLVDKGAFSLYASEEDMQRAILIQPSLVEEGLKPITYEKKVEPGFIDVYAIDKEGRMVVIEIKRRTAGKEAALQLEKYVQSLKKVVSREVRGILAAPGVAKGVQRILVTLGLDFKWVDPKKCAEIIQKSDVKRLSEFF